MSKEDLSDLAADAALAEDLGDETERTAKQLEYFGGDKDDIDDFDPTGLDDGSDLNYKAPEGDDDDDDDDDDDSDDGSDAKGDEAEDDKGDDPDGDEADDSEDDDSEGSEDDADEDNENEDDPDASDADDADADDDSEDEDEADPKPAPKGIPKHRFDEVNERRKTAEAENDRLKAELAAGKDPEPDEDPFDFDGAEKEYIALTLDGDVDGALAKRKEIRAAEQVAWTAEAKADTKTEISQEDAQAELNQMSAEAQTMFNEFNTKHEDFNQDMVNKALTYYKGYAASGEADSPADAFVMALADIVEMYGLKAVGEEETPEKDPDKDPEKKPTGKKKTSKKKKAAAKKQAHQPVAGEGVAGDDAGAVAPDIETMTDEEFDALPAKTQARMRGDFN